MMSQSSFCIRLEQAEHGVFWQFQMKTLCIYCGSSIGASPSYAAAARLLAKTMVDSNIGLVYGGGNVGLMGVIADEVIRLGGEATGIIPKALLDK